MSPATIPAYDSVDRNAILARPKKPFYDWLEKIFPEDGPHAALDENNIYLIHEMDSNEAIHKWVRKNFESLFVNELNGWNTDETTWPENRTYTMFQEWFDIEVHSMILDLEEDPVTKD